MGGLVIVSTGILEFLAWWHIFERLNNIGSYVIKEKSDSPELSGIEDWVRGIDRSWARIRAIEYCGVVGTDKK
jgi:hypothetical protein